jgi:hypothetical protein
MAQTQRFLIAPYGTGLQNDVKPWLIPEDAFSDLQNLYVWRSRVLKRLGSALLFGNMPSTQNPQLISRLRVFLGNTDGSGNLSGTVPGTAFKVGQLFSVGNDLFTVFQTGTPAAMLHTGLATGTFNTSNGAFVITGATPATPVYFYTAQPVMGFAVLETNSVNFERYLAFDQQFSYEFISGTGWTRLTSGAATWTGSNSDFFYSSMYRSVASNDLALFTTNDTIADGIRYFLASTNTWTQLTQSYSASANTGIITARIVIQFKGRLLLFNTWEQPGVAAPAQYQNRVRYSQIGNPTAVDAWYDAANGYYGKGGFLDAPVQEQIVSTQIFRDRMIVYFERSTWELVYTNNEIQPLRWQNINIELGSESTFSLIPFDKGIMGIGEVGVHVSNGINVSRIDDKIPDYVFAISNSNEGPQRVQGIRDYQNELAYWTVPTVDTSNAQLIYPNQLLVYNYKNSSWATWDDSITAFGYINFSNALSWSQLTTYTWEDWETTWNEGSNQPRMIRVVAGNQEGFTFYITRDVARCASALQITNITYTSTLITLNVISHNITNQQWILLEYIQGSGNITNLNQGIYAVISTTADTIVIQNRNVTTGTYSGGGTIALVPQINLTTKQYNFFLEKGINFSVSKMDFLIDRSSQGEVSVNIMPSTGGPIQELTLETSPYNPVYYPYEQFQDQLWHSIYPQGTGSFLQFNITWNPDQMILPDVSLEDFTLHSMLFYATPTDSRLQ